MIYLAWPKGEFLITSEYGLNDCYKQAFECKYSKMMWPTEQEAHYSFYDAVFYVTKEHIEELKRLWIEYNYDPQINRIPSKKEAARFGMWYRMYEIIRDDCGVHLN